MTNASSSDTKYIFVTGGVVSSLGKGIAAALDRAASQGAGTERHDPEVRPVYKRGSRNDVAISTWRGVRHGRRCGNRPRSRTL